jgi:UDPglucose--hexose-1-phosphate uridylyltransferase
VVIAPARARRPGADREAREPDADDEAARCPFCEGREGATPPETFALGPAGRAADAPGWWVRVVPNKFPAFLSNEAAGRGRGGLFESRPANGRQEVVIHTPRHRRSLSDLSMRELHWIAEAWQARAATASEQGFPYVQALINEGRAAGASLAHSHSQLVWLTETPPLVAQEQAAQAERGPCVLCRMLAKEREQRIRVVSERDGLVLLCPFAGRQPYELLVAPLECEEDAFASAHLGAALVLVADGLRRLRVAEGAVAVNAWVHPLGHWHIEMIPRLSTLAGLELGAGYYVNTLAPESAAGVLREA